MSGQTLSAARPGPTPHRPVEPWSDRTCAAGRQRSGNSTSPEVAKHRPIRLSHLLPTPSPGVYGRAPPEPGKTPGGPPLRSSRAGSRMQYPDQHRRPLRLVIAHASGKGACPGSGAPIPRGFCPFSAHRPERRRSLPSRSPQEHPCSSGHQGCSSEEQGCSPGLQGCSPEHQGCSPEEQGCSAGLPGGSGEEQASSPAHPGWSPGPPGPPAVHRAPSPGRPDPSARAQDNGPGTLAHPRGPLTGENPLVCGKGPRNPPCYTGCSPHKSDGGCKRNRQG